jgi:hypothetical protein
MEMGGGEVGGERDVGEEAEKNWWVKKAEAR